MLCTSVWSFVTPLLLQTAIQWMQCIYWDKLAWLGPVEWGLGNAGWKSQWRWPTKLLTRCGEQCEFNWPRPWAASGGQRVTSDNRERAGWLVNWGHGVWDGGRGGAWCGRCTVHWCMGMLHRTLGVLVLGRGMLPSTEAGLGGFIERWAALCSHGDHCNARAVHRAAGEGLECSLVYWFCNGNQSGGAKTSLGVNK